MRIFFYSYAFCPFSYSIFFSLKSFLYLQMMKSISSSLRKIGNSDSLGVLISYSFTLVSGGYAFSLPIYEFLILLTFILCCALLSYFKIHTIPSSLISYPSYRENFNILTLACSSLISTALILLSSSSFFYILSLIYATVACRS